MVGGGAGRLARPTRAVVLVAVVLAQASLGATCVDGVTPDCSDPAARCAPSVDGSADAGDTSITLPDATLDGSDGSADGDAGDADAEPDADAGDEI